MLDGALFWSTVLVCAAMFFGGTISGLELAGQFDAALANRVARLSIVAPSLVMLLRDVLRTLRR